jgi:hypothetical protein
MHKSDDCWTLPKNKNKRPKTWRTFEKQKDEKSNAVFSQDEVKAVLNFFVKAKKSKNFNKANKKRDHDVTFESDDEQLDSNMLAKLHEEFANHAQGSDNESSDDLLDYYAFLFQQKLKSSKKQKR